MSMPLGTLLAFLLIPRVARAHDGTAAVIIVASCVLFTSLFGALAITGFALGRRAAQRIEGKRLARRAIVAIVLTFPFAFLAFFVCIALDEEHFLKGDGFPLWPVGTLILQLGYVAVACRWIGKAQQATNDRTTSDRT